MAYGMQIFNDNADQLIDTNDPNEKLYLVAGGGVISSASFANYSYQGAAGSTLKSYSVALSGTPAPSLEHALVFVRPHTQTNYDITIGGHLNTNGTSFTIFRSDNTAGINVEYKICIPADEHTLSTLETGYGINVYTGDATPKLHWSSNAAGSRITEAMRGEFATVTRPGAWALAVDYADQIVLDQTNVEFSVYGFMVNWNNGVLSFKSKHYARYPWYGSSATYGLSAAPQTLIGEFF